MNTERIGYKKRCNNKIKREALRPENPVYSFVHY